MTSMTSSEVTLKEIVALAKRRGFVYPGSEIYGGFANTYSYGPYGAQLKKNIRDLWWKIFVEGSCDIIGLDGPILLHPATWRASGHVEGFSDALVDCRRCKARHRIDHLIEKATGQDVEGLSLAAMDQCLRDQGIACPKCGARDFTPSRHFNLMFETAMAKTEEDEVHSKAYLRPETAQAIFIDFGHLCDTMRRRLPFGVAQMGKAFRNEITPGNFIFRTIEFEQMEIEYFIGPDEWQGTFTSWLERMWRWCDCLGLDRSHLSCYEHPPEKLSHYSKRTVDFQYDFPFGRSELYGLAYRGDFDLRQHQNASGKSLEYTDPHTQQRFLPHVIEPTFGLDRSLLALLCDSYRLQTLEGGDTRCWLRLPAYLAPVHVAIFPLMKREPLVGVARELEQRLRCSGLRVEYDESGAIGKRYRRQDEIGTPFCVTVDFETLEQKDVTLRDRDTMEQRRLPIEKLVQEIRAQVEFPAP